MKYENTVSVVYPEEFCRWLAFEIHNIYTWNSGRPECIYKQRGKFNILLEWKNVWKVSIFNNKILFESEKRWFSLRKGLTFFTEKGYIKIT